MSTHSAPSTRPAWMKALLTPLGLAVAVVGLVLALIWPALTSSPHDIPISLAGPAAATEQAAEALTAATGDLFDITLVADRDAAVASIEQRDAYGAVVLGAQPEVLTTTAGSSSVAQILARLAPTVQAQLAQAGQTVQVTVTDVVPLSADDPNGAGLAVLALPMLFAGMLGGMGIGFTVTGVARRLAALAVYGVAAGILLSAVLGDRLGIVQGGFWLDATVFGLAALSIAAFITGTISLLGRSGAAVGPVVFMLFANPISSFNAPTQFLPGVWGTVGQWFPPGAAGTLIRTVSYFPEASTAFPWAVLFAWTAVGVLLVVLSSLRRAPQPAPEVTPEAAGVAVAV